MMLSLYGRCARVVGFRSLSVPAGLRQGQLTGRTSFRALQTPLRSGKWTLPSRFVETSAALRESSEDGHESEQGTELPLDLQVDQVAISLVDDRPDWDILAEALEGDARALLQKLQELQIASGPFEMSIELSDDTHIAVLNKEWRGKEGPTDVLSFETDSPPGYPFHLLGDIVISLQTAGRQASERGHTVRDECRILLVHGLLHTLGHDHEEDEAGLQAMVDHETSLLAALEWQGKGLIASASPEESLHSGEEIEFTEASSSSSSGTSSTARFDVKASLRKNTSRDQKVKLLALDMDGTLLDGQSKVLPSSVDALHAALAAGVKVCLATGKARPAAISAMDKVGLAGEGLVVSKEGPGLFLQGLAVHGYDGTLLEGPDLPLPVSEMAFKYAAERNVPLAAFLGDECVTLRLHPELEDIKRLLMSLQELHYRYYEPLCREVQSLDELLQGPPIKKLLFMTDAGKISSEHEPYWTAAVQELGADTTMAVPNMLEIVPRGINKWVGMQLLLEDLQIDSSALMSCGDGMNDLQLVSNSGIGIAMGNAVPAVKEAAKFVVSSNDEGGIADAVERFIL